MHNGGFISVENYWNIGSPDRGQDGDTARDAAKKYNDHRHSAANIINEASMIAWIEEKELASYHPNNPSNIGGIIEDNTNLSIRKSGDIASYGGVMWMFDGNNVIALGNPGVFLGADGQVVRKSFVTEYPFTTYGQFSAPHAPLLNNKPKQYVGSVVVNYADYALNPDGLSSSVEIVAGIRSNLLDEQIIEIAQTHPEVALMLTENGGASLRATFRIERFSMIPDPQISGEGRFLVNIDENIEIPLTAYSDNGFRLSKRNLPFVSGTTYMYNLYIIKPTADEILEQLDTTPEALAILNARLSDIIDDSSIEVLKASIKLRNLA